MAVPQTPHWTRGIFTFQAVAHPKLKKHTYSNIQLTCLYLKCRYKEMVVGGKMVLTLIGRAREDPKEIFYIWDCLATVLKAMVLQVVIWCDYNYLIARIIHSKKFFIYLQLFAIDLFFSLKKRKHNIFLSYLFYYWYDLFIHTYIHRHK